MRRWRSETQKSGFYQLTVFISTDRRVCPRKSTRFAREKEKMSFFPLDVEFPRVWETLRDLESVVFHSTMALREERDNSWSPCSLVGSREREAIHAREGTTRNGRVKVEGRSKYFGEIESGGGPCIWLFYHYILIFFFVIRSVTCRELTSIVI